MKEFARGVLLTVLTLCFVAFCIALRPPSLNELFVRMKDATDDYDRATGAFFQAALGPPPWQPRDPPPEPPAES